MNDIECKRAVCEEGKTRSRYWDSNGLFLEVSPRNTKTFYWKYYFDGAEKRVKIGRYPDTSLKSARDAQVDLRRMVQAGIDPVQKNKEIKIGRRLNKSDSFEVVAREYFVKHSAKRFSESHATRWINLMENDAFPFIGTFSLNKIKPTTILGVLKKIEGRGAIESTHRLRQQIGQVFAYGIASGLCESNPAADLRGALTPHEPDHMAALLEPKDVGGLMRSIQGYKGSAFTRAALHLSAMLFQRPRNIREMAWRDIDLKAQMWAIPSEQMKRSVQAKKSGRPHLVPLAPQAIQVLKDVRPLTLGDGFVFPSERDHDRPMSENTILAALRRMGYSDKEMTPHGFRAMARTLIVERLDVASDVIEAQLAHSKSGPLGAAYDRAEFLEKRKAMMRAWATYLAMLRDQPAAKTQSRSRN